MTFVNISGYKFIELCDLPLLQKQLKSHCQIISLKGTILLSSEGVNIHLAGLETAINRFISFLRNDTRFADILYKISFSDILPFKRLHVKIKPEIITTGLSNLKPFEGKQSYLSPLQLKQWLDDQKDFTLLDTRNDYEIQAGSFTNALSLNIHRFQKFFDRIQDLPSHIKNKPIVMFCTGGIRCEKALLPMLKAGFSQIYQLEGGILNYFTQCGGTYYKGDCFVFDDRTHVTPSCMEKN